MLATAVKPTEKANPTWERLAEAIQRGMERLAQDTAAARRRQTPEAAMAACVGSQTLTGDVLDASSTMPFALRFDEILDLIEEACAAVLDVASAQTDAKGRELVRQYARNIGMRFRILESLSRDGREAAVATAKEYGRRLEAGDPADLNEMCLDAERIAAPLR